MTHIESSVRVPVRPGHIMYEMERPPIEGLPIEDPPGEWWRTVHPGPIVTFRCQCGTKIEGPPSEVLKLVYVHRLDFGNPGLEAY